MKVKMLFSGFKPDCKCGAAAIIPAAGSVVGSIGGSLITANSSEKIANKNLDAQQRENQLNRDWQTQQAELARQYNTQERLSAQQWNEQMQDKQNAYNDPSAQAARYRAAGINPNLALGGSGVQSISASPASSSGQSSPTPSPVGGLSPVSQQPLDLQIPQLMSGIGSMFKNFAEAKQLGVNTDILSQSAEYLIKNNMLDAQQKELANGLLVINKYVEDEIKDARITRAWDESKKAMYDALISANEADRDLLIRKVMESQANLNDVLANYHGKNAELVGLEISNFDKKLNAYLKLSNAQTKQALSTVEVNQEKARFDKFSNDMRDNFKISEYDVYIKDLNAKGLLSDADAYEAMRKLSILSHVRGSQFIKLLDESLEWIKGKMSIFGK